MSEPSPFERHEVSEGYPLDKTEEKELREGLERVREQKNGNTAPPLPVTPRERV